MFLAVVLVELHGLMRVMRNVWSQGTGSCAKDLRLQEAGAAVSTPTGSVEQLVGFGSIVLDAALARHEHFGQIETAGGVCHGPIDQLSVRGFVRGGTKANVPKQIGSFLVPPFKQRHVFTRGKACDLDISGAAKTLNC